MSSPASKQPSARARIPWWLAVLLAIASYVLLKHLAPDFAQSAGYPRLAEFFVYLAPLITIAFLLLAATLLYAGDSQSRSSAGEKDDSGKASGDADTE